MRLNKILICCILPGALGASVGVVPVESIKHATATMNQITDGLIACRATVKKEKDVAQKLQAKNTKLEHEIKEFEGTFDTQTAEYETAKRDLATCTEHVAKLTEQLNAVTADSPAATEAARLTAQNRELTRNLTTCQRALDAAQLNVAAKQNLDTQLRELEKNRTKDIADAQDTAIRIATEAVRDKHNEEIAKLQKQITQNEKTIAEYEKAAKKQGHEQQKVLAEHAQGREQACTLSQSATDAFANVVHEWQKLNELWIKLFTTVQKWSVQNAQITARAPSTTADKENKKLKRKGSFKKSGQSLSVTKARDEIAQQIKNVSEAVKAFDAVVKQENTLLPTIYVQWRQAIVDQCMLFDESQKKPNALSTGDVSEGD